MIPEGSEESTQGEGGASGQKPPPGQQVLPKPGPTDEDPEELTVSLDVGPITPIGARPVNSPQLPPPEQIDKLKPRELR
jgi:hypothetical protein